MIRTIFFDLDGTLLPMDQDTFIKAYFKGLAATVAPHGIAPEDLVDAIWKGTGCMVKNDGTCTKEERFWQYFSHRFGRDIPSDIALFEGFYRTDFQKVANACGFTPAAAETVSALKEMGLSLVLATNPIFPAIATESRIRWAGLQKEDFIHYTTYENSCYSKPNPAYYQNLLDTLGLKAEECLMVGNDVGEDMVARSIGMQVFLLTDCLINKNNEDIDAYPHGSFAELMAFVRAQG